MAIVAWSGFWGDGVGTTGKYSQLEGNKLPGADGIRKMVSHDDNRITTAVLNGLLGAAVGANTLNVTRTRVLADPPYRGDGGLRKMEIVQLVSGVTTAAQLSQAQYAAVATNYRPSYPADASGNGGKAFT